MNLHILIARAALAGGVLVLTAGCSVTAPLETGLIAVTPAVTYYPTLTPPVTRTPPPTATPTVRLGAIDPGLPSDVRSALADAVAAAGLKAVSSNEADGVVARYSSAGAGPVVFTRTYALAAPFPTIADGVKWSDLQAFWNGDPKALASVTNDGSVPAVYMDQDTRQGLISVFRSAPAPNARIVVTNTDTLAGATFAARPGALAVLPFRQLEQRWKLLKIDDAYLFDKALDPSKYPLTLRVREVQSPAAPRSLVEVQTDRDPARLAVVAMTGVTALVRGTAVKMEQNGVLYPGAKIRDWLRSADVAHISNEVSFYDKCRPPTLADGTVMCSSPKYIELLKDVGTDIIELTGNHLWDYGWQNLLPTIETYNQLGWKYFGGGRNLSDALRPLTMTVNGTKLAFIGCNWFGSDWATDKVAGSAPCGKDSPRDLDYIVPAIQQLRKQGYQVIATLQYEEYYRPDTTRNQERDFRALRDAGAVVVNGSQGHHVQGFDVNSAGFIHYGTGNLFFGDQTFSKGTLQTFVDRHAFYDGRYLGADLRTAQIEDLSQPRPMTSKERADLLDTLFKVSYFDR